MKYSLAFFVMSIFAGILCAQNETPNDSYHNIFLSQLESEFQLTGGSWVLSNTEVATADSAIFYGPQTVSRKEVDGRDFSLATNFKIQEIGANPWDAGYFNESLDTIQEGDRV